MSPQYQEQITAVGHTPTTHDPGIHINSCPVACANTAFHDLWELLPLKVQPWEYKCRKMYLYLTYCTHIASQCSAVQLRHIKELRTIISLTLLTNVMEFKELSNISISSLQVSISLFNYEDKLM